MSSAVLLAFTPDANMRAVGEAADAAGLALMLCGPEESPSRWSLPRDRPLVLLAVGPEGGATLAAWVDAHGLEGVAGVGLVGVTAPWAARLGCDDPAHKGAPCGRPLPSLEPLRGVAEQARRATKRLWDISVLPMRKIDPLLLVVACAPDDGVCVGCQGRCSHMGFDEGVDCKTCDGTGKALSSRDVAAELVGSLPGPWTANPATFGGADGVQGLLYPTRAALDEHGLRAVVARLAR